MNDNISHLNPYKYEDDDKFSPYKCCDIHISMNDEISGVTEDLQNVAAAINKNTYDISILSGDVASLSGQVHDIIEKNAEQDRQISGLSASSSSNTTDANYYTIESADTKFATNEYLSALTDAVNIKADLSALSEVYSAVTSNTNSINSLLRYKADRSDFETLSSKVVDDESILLGKLDSSAFTEHIESFSALSGHVSANTDSVAELSAKTNNIQELSGIVSSITDDINEISGVVSANVNSVSALSADVATISANTLHNSGEIESAKTDINRLKEDFGKINNVEDYVKNIANNKADKTDLDALSSTVISLEDTVSTKANQSDLEASNAEINTNEKSINSLKLNKQDKGCYVSATTLDNYYTKEQTSGATEIQKALNAKQDMGNYALKSDLDNYYTKSETIDKDDYNTFTANINTELDKRANKNALEQLTSRVTATEKKADTAASDLNNFKDEVSTTYETKKNVVNGINDVKDSIQQNTTNISKISEMANLEKYDPNTGEFDNSGNGVLDVLHKEFHNLISGYSEDDLVGLIKKLDERITKLENK